MGVEKLANLCARKPWWTVLFWLILMVVSGFVVFKFLGEALTTEQRISVEIESEKAEKLLADRLGIDDQVTELVIIKSDHYLVSDPEFQQFTLGVQKELQDLGSATVESTVSFFQTQNPAFVSKNQDATVVIANLAGSLSKAEENIDQFAE